MPVNERKLHACLGYTYLMHCCDIQPGEQLATHEVPCIRAKVSRANRGKVIPTPSK